ncbi:YbaB/EbfC family nucleoid-associated protein [Nocardia sp. NEAU-G5]|uniref:YbaB/EbfC family nucleoid-associated protein n=1 Tax=Nocardia albiluteola TaxID=2842303 RepID=A0ABS6AY66_9NOCA|nr:YbaB/EbfC family nucleoid-associated protein [Nocardia albiluteola]MBU3062977.1 YbaB/EbfC family nucleoid-associated protein [Nocardia albiluteola]
MKSGTADVVEQLRDNAERLNALADRLRAIRAEERSPDGAVTVTVDGNGEMVDLRLSTAIMRLSPKEFERTLVTTAEHAARRAFAEHGGLIAEFGGGEPTSMAPVADRAEHEQERGWL